MAQQLPGVRKTDPAWAESIPATIMVGMFTSPIDAKGRIAIPEPLLRVLSVASKTGIGLCLSRYYKCIEGCGVDFAPHMILNNPIRTPIDSAGRIEIPVEWMTRVGFTDRVAIIGMERAFQIWEPNEFAEEKRRLLDRKHRH